MTEIILFIFVGIVLALVFFGFGVLYSNRKRKDQSTGKRIEEYPFYPFIKSESGHIEFNIDMFVEAVSYLLKNRDTTAAKQLIVIGEQNLVRDVLSSTDLNNYKKLYNQYDGSSILNDNDQYLENFKRIVSLVGKSFPDTGIEILLHNLVNPSKSVVAIENGEVTGRKIENGTTSLVLDLKTRKERNQDKLNYELNIGSRKFKCTTIPIFRRDYGLVGAICINIDVHFIKDYVANDQARLERFIDNLLKTDFELEENILSKAEYKKSLNGKKHFLDNPILRQQAKKEEREILVIMFSDIVNYTGLMNSDEHKALKILENNRANHMLYIQKNHGKILKEMGDGILVSFKSVLNAVNAAMDLQQAMSQNEDYQLRIGIHMGEVINSGNDIFGDGVNIASRIQGVAEPGGIVISEVVYQNVRNKLSATPALIGDKKLKNVAGTVKLYQL
jgi:class 3 adenylate cyclase